MSHGRRRDLRAVFVDTSASSWLVEIDDYYLESSVSYQDLSRKVSHYPRAADIVKGRRLDVSGISKDYVTKLGSATAKLYGLLHARFLLTGEGVDKLSQKVAAGIYGVCPRVACGDANLLPMGLTGEPGIATVKRWCLKCHDIYENQSDLDAAYFGPDLPVMFCKLMQIPLSFQVLSTLLDTYQDDAGEKVPAIKQRLVRWGEREARIPLSDGRST
jgi:casein kinase II subunit beta